MISNTCEPKSETPSTDPGEEVVLAVASKIDGFDVTDIPRVDVAGRDQVLLDEMVQPLRSEGVVLVVVGARLQGEVSRSGWRIVGRYEARGKIIQGSTSVKHIFICGGRG